MNSSHRRVIEAVCADCRYRVLKRFTDGQTGCSVYLVTNGKGFRIVKIGTTERAKLEIGRNVEAHTALMRFKMAHITPRPLKLVGYGNSTVLVMEYGGIPLNHLLAVSNYPDIVLQSLTHWLLGVYSKSIQRSAFSRNHVTQSCFLIQRKVLRHFPTHPICNRVVELLRRLRYIPILPSLNYSCFANTDLMPDDVSWLATEQRYYFLDLHTPVLGMPLIDLGVLLAGIESDPSICGFGEKHIMFGLAEQVVDLFGITHEVGFVLFQLGKILHDVYAARYSECDIRREELLVRAEHSLQLIYVMLNGN